MNKPSTSGWTYEDYLKIIPTVIVGVSSLFFVLGLLIVNLHLARYGVYTTEFLRTEYILAGAVLILIMSMAEVAFSHIMDWTWNSRTRWRNGEYSSIFSDLIRVAIIVFAVPLALIMLRGDEDVNFRSLGVPLLGILFSSLMFYNAYSIAKSSISKLQNSEEHKESASGVHKELSKLFLPLLSTLIAITTYANTVHPYISVAFGGANRAPALVFLTPRGVEVSKSLSFSINVNQTIGPVKILTESEKELIILVQNGPTDEQVAIQLSKSLIEAVQTKTNSRFKSNFSVH